MEGRLGIKISSQEELLSYAALNRDQIRQVRAIALEEGLEEWRLAQLSDSEVIGWLMERYWFMVAYDDPEAQTIYLIDPGHILENSPTIDKDYYASDDIWEPDQRARVRVAGDQFDRK